MEPRENQKLKMLYLVKILTENTDDEHSLDQSEISNMLAQYGVGLGRKTLYMDLEELRKFGVDVISEKQKDNRVLYHVGSRRFELPELKLLVDSVQSAKFLSEKKSRELIRKIESLGSRYEAKYLHRQVYIAGRIKSMNESIYYNVDILHDAINSDKQIRFHYYQWNVKKKMELRHNGEEYQVSPWGLMWDDENYYLVAFDAEDKCIKHFRVDKMLNITFTEEKRLGSKEFKDFDLPKYTKSLFGMFSGEMTSVTLEGRNDLVGVVIDRFGKDISIVPRGEDHFQAQVNIAISRQFLGWMFAIGDGLRITAPENVVALMKEEAKKLMKMYDE